MRRVRRSCFECSSSGEMDTTAVGKTVKTMAVGGENTHQCGDHSTLPTSSWVDRNVRYGARCGQGSHNFDSHVSNASRNGRSRNVRGPQTH